MWSNERDRVPFISVEKAGSTRSGRRVGRWSLLMWTASAIDEGLGDYIWYHGFRMVVMVTADTYLLW